MKVKFIGDPRDESDDTKVCTMFGVDFFREIETDVSELSDHAKDKLSRNRHFVVVGIEAPRRGPGRPRKLDQEPATDGDVSDEAAA